MAKKVFKGDPDLIFNIMLKRIRHKIALLDPKTPEFHAVLERAAITIVTQTKINITKQGLVDRNHLRESIGHEFESPNVVKIGSFGIPYAAIHEFGGPITPINRQFLTIPLRTEFKHHSARDFNDLFVHRSPKTNELFLAQKRGGNIIYAYKLVKFVQIPARPYLGPAFHTHKKTIRNSLRGYIIGFVYGGN